MNHSQPQRFAAEEPAPGPGPSRPGQGRGTGSPGGASTRRGSPREKRILYSEVRQRPEGDRRRDAPERIVIPGEKDSKARFRLPGGWKAPLAISLGILLLAAAGNVLVPDWAERLPAWAQPGFLADGGDSSEPAEAAVGGATSASAGAPSGLRLEGGEGTAGPSVAGDPNRPGSPSAASGALLARFQVLVDSLATSLERYRERGRDFDVRRIGCSGLARGYAGVNGSFVELAVLRGDLRGELDRSGRETYDTLMEETEVVDRHFDATGCSRPR